MFCVRFLRQNEYWLPKVIIITYDKYNGLELYITADDIVPVGDGWVYTVTLVNNATGTGMPIEYLAAETK